MSRIVYADSANHWGRLPRTFCCTWQDFAIGGLRILHGIVTFEDTSTVGQVCSSFCDVIIDEGGCCVVVIVHNISVGIVCWDQIT